MPAQQPTEAEIICAIVTHIRTGLFTADDIADCIEGTYGADVADHAYELIYDHAGDAVDCLWEFNPMGWLMMPSFQHQQIPIMF